MLKAENTRRYARAYHLSLFVFGILLLPASLFVFLRLMETPTNTRQFAATGNQCGNCVANAACSLNGQFCEQPISCSGNTPVTKVYVCTNGKWVYKYVQNGGSCPNPCPYKVNYAGCGGNVPGQCTNNPQCPSGSVSIYTSTSGNQGNSCGRAGPGAGIPPGMPVQCCLAKNYCATLPLTIPVLVLGYFPPDPNNPNYIDPVETGWTLQHYAIYGITQPLTISQWHDAVNKMITGMIPEITDNTRYHGYKDSSATPFLTWKIADQKFFDVPVPKGVRDSEPGNPYRPNYNQILTSQNICNYVDNQGVKEVWMYSYHKDGYMSPDESRMSSKFGDISNSFPNGTNVDPSLILPVCKNSYVLYNFESLPNSSYANSVHNRMHQIEATISYADHTYRLGPGPQSKFPNSLFWGNFALYTGEGSFTACGWTHTPPNTTSSYDYSNTTSVSSDCENWNPDSKAAQFSSVTCTKWGCTDLGFYKWWMQNNPGFNNKLSSNGQPMRNWWESMYDFNAFITQGQTLTGPSLLACVNPPNPLSATPTFTPTPTPTPTGGISPSTTQTPSPSVSPQPSITNNPNATSFTVTLLLHGLGAGGDNVNPNSGGNTNPQHPNRTATMTISDTSNNPVGTPIQVAITYQSDGTFQGTANNISLASGNYIIAIKTDGFLQKQYSNIFQPQPGQTITLPKISLVTGDITNDNQLDISDYNALISCFGNKLTQPSCSYPITATSTGADINDDGVVDGVDYNLFIRELSVQKSS